LKTSQSIETAEKLRAQTHANCVVCGPENPNGLQLDFQVLGEGEVGAAFEFGPAFEGYAQMLHGGVISSILDGAMTHCLFAHGTVAVTAELKVRFRHPVKLGIPGQVRARRERHLGALHIVKAEITQEGQIRATATAKFMSDVQNVQHRTSNVE
jgi:uncharacterized protein (TIGR00369 family)